MVYMSFVSRMADDVIEGDVLHVVVAAAFFTFYVF